MSTKLQESRFSDFYPPSQIAGPPNYPFVGGTLSLPQADIHLKQEEWKRQYGFVVGAMLGPQPAVFIQGYPYVQEGLKKAEFQGRPQTPDFKERSFGELLGKLISASLERNILIWVGS